MIALLLGLVSCFASDRDPAVPSLTHTEAATVLNLVTLDAAFGHQQCVSRGDEERTCHWTFDLVAAYIQRADRMSNHWHETGSQGQFRCLMMHIHNPLLKLTGKDTPGVLATSRMSKYAPERCAP